MESRVCLAPVDSTGGNADPALLPPTTVAASELHSAVPPGHPFLTGADETVELDLPLLNGSVRRFVARCVCACGCVGGCGCERCSAHGELFFV